MKLVRFGRQGEERPGVLVHEAGEEKILDIRSSAFDIEDFNGHFFSHHGLERVAALLKESKRSLIPAKHVRLGAPVARPSKIICLGKNYADHARECNSQPPASPILFSKATTAINGPNDPILLPPGHGSVDGEVELAVVIGSKALRVPENAAMAHVAGYMIFNDVTDRDAQRAGQQWFRGKGPDTFCPLGPWLVTADEIADPHALKLKFSQNGRVLQDGTTKDMMFKIPYIIAFISAAMTLLPGDVIATGTPAGIGSAHTPPVVFNPGDRIELEIEGLGRQANEIISAV